MKDTGNQLIKTKIDKTKITDTGTETIKEGLTDIRYADNTRKVVLNTARSTVKAGYAVKNMPRETRSQVNRIKNNAKKAREAAKKTADVVKKVLTSTYEHTSSMYTCLEIYTYDGGTISGSGYADIYDGMWRLTYSIGSDAYAEIDWDNFYLTVSTVYCDNPNHCYICGNVYNHSIETVMQEAGFDEDEREIYEIYLAQIETINEG